MTAETVVCLPRRTLALISPMRSLRPGCTAIEQARLAGARGTGHHRDPPGERRGELGDPLAGLRRWSRRPRSRPREQRSISAVPGSSSTLLTTTAAGMALASATTSSRSMSWGIGAGSTVAVTTKTWSMLAATGRVPRPSGTRRSSSVVRGSTPTMPWSSASGRAPAAPGRRRRPGWCPAWPCPASTARISPLGRRDPIDRAVALRARCRAARSPLRGRAGDRLVQRGLDVVQRERLRAALRPRPAVRPQARVSVSTWPTGRSPPGDQRTKSSAAP